MSKIIIHIGTHKTATTSIQGMMFHNRALLAKKNIIIPVIGKSCGHHSLVTEWINMKPDFQLPNGPDAAWNSLVKKYAHKDVTVFISSEEFSRIQPKCVNMRQLRERVRAFDKVEIVCVLRNQINFVQSVYMEISKNRNMHGMHNFIINALGEKMTEGLWLDYNKLYSHIRTGFKAEQIRLVSFENAIKTEAGIIGYFLKILEADLTVESLRSFQKSASNISPQPLALWAANVVTAPKRMTPKLLKLAYDALKIEFGENIKTTLFTTNEIEQYSKKFELLNRNLEERISLKQPDFCMAPVFIDTEYIHRDMVSDTFWVKYIREIYNYYSIENPDNE
jgi:hypothetical protein